MKNLFNIKSWFITMLPAGLIISMGVLQFKDAVLQSVQMSPHPQIIYLIATGFVFGVITLSMALHRCLSERSFLLKWSSKSKADGADLLHQFSSYRSITPLLMVISSMHTRAPHIQQENIEKEVEEFDKYIHQGLNFPAYVSGALIGLGLVGTFVGLLGSLQEMADIISSMMNAPGSGGGQSPFSEMLRKLKRPMEGMGTAFVASMYGLMGSLLLEWMLVSVRRVCNQIMLNVRQVIREHEMADVAINADIETIAYPQATVSPDQFLSVVKELQSNQQLLTSVVEKHQETEQVWLNTQNEYISTIAGRQLIDKNTQELLRSNLQVSQQTLQVQQEHKLQMLEVQEAYQQQVIQVQEAFLRHAMESQEVNKQQLLQVQMDYAQQALQLHEAYKHQMKEFSVHLTEQFVHLSIHTQQLNLQTAALNNIYQAALNKPHVLIRIWTGIASSIQKRLSKKKS